MYKGNIKKRNSRNQVSRSCRLIGFVNKISTKMKQIDHDNELQQREIIKKLPNF